MDTIYQLGEKYAIPPFSRPLLIIFFYFFPNHDICFFLLNVSKIQRHPVLACFKEDEIPPLRHCLNGPKTKRL